MASQKRGTLVSVVASGGTSGVVEPAASFVDMRVAVPERSTSEPKNPQKHPGSPNAI